MYDVTNSEIVIHLPATLLNNRKVMVTVEDMIVSNADKVALLKIAATDPLFLAEVKEANDDFKSIYNESLMNIKRWFIYKDDLDPVIGSEQDKASPALVISENEINDLL